MPDDPRTATPLRPARRNQRKGCGFPVAKWLALFDVATGMLLRSATAPLRTHDMSASSGRSPTSWSRAMSCWATVDFARMLIWPCWSRRGLHAVFRIHQRQIVDFTPGRPQARGGVEADAAGAAPLAVGAGLG